MRAAGPPICSRDDLALAPVARAKSLTDNHIALWISPERDTG
jgi:hypothetical protein